MSSHIYLTEVLVLDISHPKRIKLEDNVVLLGGKVFRS